MKRILLIALLFALLTGCANDAENSIPTINNKESIDIGSETEKIDEREIDMSEAVAFDLENTMRILQDALEGEVRESLMIEPLLTAGVNGIVSAEWIERGQGVRNTLKITSEDNRVYELFVRQNRITGWVIIEMIRNQDGDFIFDDDPNHGLPTPPGLVDIEDLEFDLQNTIRVMENAIDNERNHFRSWVFRAFPARDIKGAISAELSGNTEDGYVQMKIETEDNRFYLLTLESNLFRLIEITDYETGEIVEPNRQR